MGFPLVAGGIAIKGVKGVKETIKKRIKEEKGKYILRGWNAPDTKLWMYWILHRPDYVDAVTMRMLHAHARYKAAAGIGRRKGVRGHEEMRTKVGEKRREKEVGMGLIPPVAALYITYIVTQAQEHYIHTYIYIICICLLLPLLCLSLSHT